MLALHEIIILLYPNKSLAERDSIQMRCEKFGVDFDTKAWLAVLANDLSTNVTKDNLVLTLFYNQDSYSGVIGEILRTLEIQSSGIIYFPNLDAETNDFYERYYGIAGFTFFAYLAPTTQIYLLGSRFLLLASIWGLPILTRLQQYFARFCSLEILKQDAVWFAEAIKKNNTPLQVGVNLGVWVVSGNERIKLNDLLAQESGMEIVKVYEQLVSGKIWSDLDFCTCNHSKVKYRENSTPEEIYLHRLQETKDLSGWIQDYADIARWCRGKNPDFVKKILVEIKNKLPLNEFDEVIVNFISELSAAGFSGLSDVIIFNESTSQFEWNPELLS